MPGVSVWEKDPRCLTGDGQAAEAEEKWQLPDSFETVENQDEVKLGLWVTLVIAAIVLCFSPWMAPKLVTLSRSSHAGASSFSPGYFWPAFQGEPAPVTMAQYRKSFADDDPSTSWEPLDPDGDALVDADHFLLVASKQGLDRQKAEFVFRQLDCNMDTLLTQEEFIHSLSCTCDWEDLCPVLDVEWDEVADLDQLPRWLQIQAASQPSSASSRSSTSLPRDSAASAPYAWSPTVTKAPPLRADSEDAAPRKTNRQGSSVLPCSIAKAAGGEVLSDYLQRLQGRGSVITLSVVLKGLRRDGLSTAQLQDIQQAVLQSLADDEVAARGSITDLSGQAGGLSIDVDGEGSVILDGFLRLRPAQSLNLTSAAVHSQRFKALVAGRMQTRTGAKMKPEAVVALVKETVEGDFFKLDTHDDAGLNREEFMAAAQVYLQPAAPDAVAQDYFDVLDTNADGKLDSDEFFARKLRTCLVA